MPKSRRRSPRAVRPRRSPGRSEGTPEWVWAVLLAIGLAGVAWIWVQRSGHLSPGTPADSTPPVATSKPVPKPSSLKPSPAAPKPTVALPVVVPPVIVPKPLLPAESTVATPAPYPRPVETLLEAQVALALRLFSSGSIDGVPGAQTEAALRAFQENEGLSPTGWLDGATRTALILRAPAVALTEVTADDLASLQPVSPTWLGKSQQATLAYETALELVAERTHAHPALLRRLNPEIAWENLRTGTRVLAPALSLPVVTRRMKIANLHVRLAARVLQARGEDGQVIAHFPVSIARNVDKRPVGRLTVVVAIPHPDYTFNPEVFPESAEARELGRKLLLPPGPNNPVGLAWIGLDRPGYGIHGTPGPEQVGRTESHGCFRLANWDALALVNLVSTGVPVFVEP